MIEQSVVGSNYASVERLSPSWQWLPTGETIVVRRAMSESEAFRTRYEVPREKKLTVSNVDGPTVIDACGLCLGDNLSTEAGGVILNKIHDALFDLPC